MFITITLKILKLWKFLTHSVPGTNAQQLNPFQLNLDAWSLECCPFSQLRRVERFVWSACVWACVSGLWAWETVESRRSTEVNPSLLLCYLIQKVTATSPHRKNTWVTVLLWTSQILEDTSSRSVTIPLCVHYAENLRLALHLKWRTFGKKLPPVQVWLMHLLDK